ncbi:DEAD/DEAH box helicase family protein [Helicobacter pylori]|nr:DEAD/DEAH box helicase family protein [Helicobacter pylori]
MAKKKQEVRNNEIFVAQKLAEEELNANEINDPLEMLDFKSFDNNKELLDYQQQALINAFRMLVAYFRDFKENKKEFYAFYQKHYSFANCDFAKKKLNHLLKNSFKVENHCVRFENFINRLAFYMATGSGKTIVIIKLVELLSVAMGMGLIPKKNIMFFSANEHLIKQFEKEIEKYNRNKDYSKQIDFKNLKGVKNKDFYHSPKDFLMEKIALFYYRADLMSDEESKENLLNYKDCWDNGENYVILDEAHKGNKTESKRQAIFSLLSLKGFLFNFSATFTEESDLITAVYNLSVGEWVKLGYGKESVLLKKNNLNAFKELKDLNDREKEIALLKALLLLGMQKRHKTEGYFHDPLMLVFTHSVNVENSDAEIFLKTLARVIENDDGSDFLKAKDDLLEELKNPEFLFSDGKDQDYKIEVFKESLKGMDFKGLKEEVFYASNGHIEVIINPKNNQEIAFKLNTSDKVFCLIRIGDITEWIHWHYKDLDDLISILKKRLYPNQKVPKDEFSALDDEKIVHFKRIQVKASKKEELIQAIQEVKEYAPLDKETLRMKIAQGEIDIDNIDKHKQDKTFKVDEAELLKLKEHYYTPLIKAKNCGWLKHVVNVESEIDFLKELQKTETMKTLQENYDFWAFSKIDEHLDNLFIPYIDNGATERKFFPDFIFWLQKGGTQFICFIDPKGTEHTSSQRKAVWYKKLFKDKVFNPKNDPNLKIKVVLKFYGDKDKVVEGRDYWIKKGELKDFFLKQLA